MNKLIEFIKHLFIKKHLCKVELISCNWQGPIAIEVIKLKIVK